MGPSTTVKRKWTEERMAGKLTKKPRKNIKRQKNYYSSSDSEGDDLHATDAPRGEKRAPKERATGANAELARPEGAPPQKQRKARPAPAEKAEAAEKKTEDKPAAKALPKSALKAVVTRDATPDSDDEDDDMDGSDDESSGVEDLDALEDSDDNEVDEFEGGSDMDANAEAALTQKKERQVKKRNDPEAFATSISRILSAKLTSSKRSEPILARSKSAADANKTLADHKLTLKAKRDVVQEKKAALDKGRVKDVMGLSREEVSTAAIVAEEKALRRTAQKGVIKLFNAVRAAQVKAEQAEKEAKSGGVVGIQKREELVKEVSKQSFLDMITGGGKKNVEGSEASA